MNDQELEQRKQNIIKVAKISLVAIAAAVVAPVVFLMVKGILGLALAGFASLVIVNAAPVVANGLADWRLKALKAEAARNPIETLQLDFQQKRLALHKFKDSITGFSAAVMTFQDKMDGFKAKFPKDADKFDGELAKMKQVLKSRETRFKEAQASLNQYANEIDRAKAIWEMGQEAQKMNAASGLNDEDLLAKIRVDTALDSVTGSMNTAFAELETSLLEDQDTKETQRMIEAKVVEALPAPTRAKETAHR